MSFGRSVVSWPSSAGKSRETATTICAVTVIHGKRSKERGKSSDVDNVPADLLKQGEEETTKALTVL